MLKVLIVEDNAAYRQTLRQLLIERFPALEVGEAADADAALREALTLRFRLIFMDIRLRQGNGIELTRTIKGFSPATVICVISSYDMLEYREAALRNGADHFMVKGESTSTEILDLVESLLREDERSSRARRDPGSSPG